MIGWRQTGTSLGVELALLWLDIDSGQATPLEVHGVDNNPIFNHDGKRLLYGRTQFPDPKDIGQTTIYQLEVGE